tara:strand:+ start:503 stop:2350 length:1848 start_codon:yes stop_codon:yes gene_type:complete
MATTINSTALDFANIKTNLKTYLANTTEFADYDFEASGLSNILDVLAYNTHINGLTTNFALNESFLGTAQLRSSVVSLATGIGYVPDTMTSSKGTVGITMDLNNVSGRPSTVDLPTNTRFSSTVDDITYTFQTREVHTASDDGNGNYIFKTTDNLTAIPIFEGTLKTKTFNVGEFNEADVYMIPDATLDADTAIVRVIDGSTSSVYTNITAATTISPTSTIYILKEAPNGFYQLSFGGNGILGLAPAAGNTITVEYLSTKGGDANTAKAFTALDTVTVLGSARTLTVSTAAAGIGGDAKETIASIRTNAPFQYATQNRMVTPEDYTSIINRNYSTLINDIISWGGQDNPEPKFGTVFSSIDFESDVTDATQTATKASIEDLVKQLAVISFNVEFADPIETFIETSLFYQINPNLTSLSTNAITNSIKTAIGTYFTANTGKFEKAFRRSALLTLVDEVSSAVLSSRAVIRMQQRIVPTINVFNAYQLSYPAGIAKPAANASPKDNDHIVRSNTFLVDGNPCRILNEQRPNVATNKLQVVESGTGTVIVDNIGSFNEISGLVTITAFRPTGLLGGGSNIKISVLPANQSAIAPERNNIIKYDASISTIIAVKTEAEN